MPNEDIDVTNLESLEKYRSYTRYLKQAEEARNKPAWWRTYRGHVEASDPEYGQELVDIGLPRYQPNRTKEVKERREVMRNNKKNVELERACRLRTCKLILKYIKMHYVVFQRCLIAKFYYYAISLQLRSRWVECRKCGRKTRVLFT